MADPVATVANTTEPEAPNKPQNVTVSELESDVAEMAKQNDTMLKDPALDGAPVVTPTGIIELNNDMTEAKKQAEDTVVEANNKIKETQKMIEAGEKEVKEAQEQKDAALKKETAAEIKVIQKETLVKLAETPEQQAVAKKDLIKAETEAETAKVAVKAAEKLKQEATKLVKKAKIEEDKAKRTKELGEKISKEIVKTATAAMAKKETDMKSMKLLEGITVTEHRSYPNVCVGMVNDAGERVMAVCLANDDKDKTCPANYSDARCFKMKTMKSDIMSMSINQKW